MFLNAVFAAPTLNLDTDSYNVWPGDLGARCENTDIPDTPITFVKLTSGQIAAYSGNGGAPQHRWTGASVDAIRRECDGSIMKSPQDCDASQYSFDFWIGGMASVDGSLVASVDMEYHGWECNNCSTAPYSTCWMNANLVATAAQTGAISTPSLVKPPHQRYIPNAGPYGSFLMSNVIKGGRGTEKGGFWYALAGQLPGPGDTTQKAGLCTFRSPSPSDGSSWTMWDGGSWVASSTSPYDGVAPACAAATNVPIRGSGCSVRWSTFYSRWIVVGTIGSTPSSGHHIFALSEDLISWTDPVSFAPWQTAPPALYYPSLVDPSAGAFDEVKQKTQVYFTYYHASPYSERESNPQSPDHV